MENICPNCFETGFTDRRARCGYIALAHEENHMLQKPGVLLNSCYVVGREPGAGGFGVTYLAKDKHSDMRMAAIGDCTVLIVYTFRSSLDTLQQNLCMRRFRLR